MMKIRGFIEGFYNRKPKKNDYSFKNSNITHYIYAPKEDSYIRQKWRIKDKSLEARSIPKNITQVYTLSPGADFKRKSKKDFNLLLSKFNFAIDKGFSEAGLLFDDIDINNIGIESDDKDLGKFHGELISEVTAKLGLSKGWFCPSIYCHSFSKKGIQNDKYLEGVSETINNDLFFLWTGPKVISDFISQDHLKELGQVIKNPVVIWDNFYANDYCPTRLFLGDITGRDFFRGNPYGHVINGTGLINTDEFLIGKVFDKKKKINLPTELLPLFDSPFKNIKKSEINKMIRNSKDIKKAVFETTDDNLFLEWKPYLVQALNDIELIKNFKSKQTIESYLHRRYSPLVSHTFNKY